MSESKITEICECGGSGGEYPHCTICGRPKNERENAAKYIGRFYENKSQARRDAVIETSTEPQPVSLAVSDLKYAWATFWNCPGPVQEEYLHKAMRNYQQEWMTRRTNARI